jgi:S-adenosylmethionine decarboxylase
LYCFVPLFYANISFVKCNSSVVPTAGVHYIVELSAKEKDFLFYNNKVLEFFNKVLKEMNATIVSVSFKEFSSCGMSGVFVLAESHLSFHTWPEENYVSVDLYVCGSKTKHSKFLKELSEKFEVNDVLIIKRGVKDHIKFKLEKFDI